MRSDFKSPQRLHRFGTAVAASFLATLLALPARAAIEVPPVPPNSGNGVPPNILFILDDSGSMVFQTMPEGVYDRDLDTNSIWHRSYVHNTIYYNPAVNYQAWMDASGSRMSGGTSYDSVYPDLNRVGGNTIDLSNSDSCRYVDENQRTDQSLKVCGGTQTFFVPKSTANQNAAYLADRDNYYRYRILGDGRVERTERVSGSWGNKQYVTPTGRTEAEERNNYATWFSYHRTRMKVAKAGASEAFSGLADDKYRVGFTTIWGPNGSGADNDQFLIPVETDNGLFRGANREAWFDTLFAARGYNGTPLLPALERAGEYYSSTDDDGPYGGNLDVHNEQFQCRQNFSILTTDGYWNSGSASSGNADNETGLTITAPDNPDGTPGQSYRYQPESPYKGANATTLADVAMSYWKRDLRGDMLNIVPVSAANPAFWQHMVTFGISIGLAGTVDQRSVKDVIAQGGVTKGGNALSDWPDPTNTEDEERIDDLLHAAVNGHGEFVAATNPTAFAKGLKDALGAISNRTSSASNVSASSTSISTNTRLFQARYIGGNWTGEVSAFPVDESGIDDGSPVWEASDGIPDWNSRDIFTTDRSGAKGSFPTATQIADLGSSGKGHSVADYIRGDQSGELGNGGDLRTRQTLLGDIIHSSPYYVRDTDTLYVGANDGMLHAFSGDDGAEVLAYVPRGVRAADLRELSSPDYAHRYFVDGPVVVSDRALTETPTHPDGRNILVGTLGRGGKGVFGLDVTDPDGFGSGDILFDTVGDADMGLVLGQPFVARLNDGSVSVVFGNGINSANGSAVLWIIDVDSGEVTKLDTGVTGNNGLSAPRGWDSDGDGAVDLVFAGDQRGNLWKFDLGGDNSNGNALWQVALGGDPLFTATDSAGTPQSISGGVTIGIDPVLYKRWLFFGTGRLLNDDDLWNDDGTPNLDVQTMYGIIDNDDSIGTRADNDDQSLATGLVKRSIKSIGTIANKPVRSFEPSDATIPVDKQGWFIDLLTPPGDQAEGERIVGNPQVVGPVLITSSIIPGNDPCIPGGRGYLNAVNAFTGASVSEHFFDVDGDGEYSDDEIGDDPVGSVDTGVGMNTDGVLIDKLIGVGGSTGKAGSVGVNNPASSGRVSWREVLGD